MYRKFISVLFICNLIWLLGSYVAGGTNGESAMPVLENRSQSTSMRIGQSAFFLHKVESGQRVVEYTTLIKKDIYGLSKDDKEALCRIVQAEAGGEDEEGKMMVAGVVLNRVEDSKFPNTVEEVVLQHTDGKYQFSPVANGRYYSVNISKETREAVDKVLAGENPAEHALYFAARKYADDDKMEWFDRHLELLYQHGGHEFFG